MNESEALGHTFSSWEGQWEGYGSIIPPPSDFQFDHYQLPNNIIFSLTFWSNRGDSEFDHYEALPAQALSPTAQITMVRRLDSIETINNNMHALSHITYSVPCTASPE